MRFYADLHVHSKYSRATSRDSTSSIWPFGRAQGHHRRRHRRLHASGLVRPEIKEKLVPAEPGLFRLDARHRAGRAAASCRPPVTGRSRFLLVGRDLDHLQEGRPHPEGPSPDLRARPRRRRSASASVSARIGNIAPTAGPSSGSTRATSWRSRSRARPDAYLIPAHIWTPWFAVLGSKSGFDSIAECYGDLADHIFAVETGLSSDPPMNWRVSSLDRYRLISNSDAHSPPSSGREATLFDSELDYFAIRRRARDRRRLRRHGRVLPRGRQVPSRRPPQAAACA